MQRTARLLALAAVLASILASAFSPRAASPILCRCSPSPAARLPAAIFPSASTSGAEPKLENWPQTFNTMSEELEHFVEDLKRAADENRALFMGSIQMLAGAVDEKDPYTRGHSDRVTRYSLLLAQRNEPARLPSGDSAASPRNCTTSARLASKITSSKSPVRLPKKNSRS